MQRPVDWNEGYPAVSNRYWQRSRRSHGRAMRFVHAYFLIACIATFFGAFLAPSYATADEPIRGMSAPTGGRQAEVTVLWSDSKEFFVETDESSLAVFHVRWQGNMGRQEKVWEMAYAGGEVSVSNNGYVAVGLANGPSSFVDCNLEEVVVSFYKDGALQADTRFGSILDVVPLAPTSENVPGPGRCLGFNACNLYVIEVFDGQHVAIEPKTGKVAMGGEQGAAEIGWLVFCDTWNCYEFSYPCEWDAIPWLDSRGILTGDVSLSCQGEMEARMTLQDSRHYSDFSNAALSVQDFVRSRTKALHCADGPCGTRYLKEVLLGSAMVTEAGLTFWKMHAKSVSETYCGTDEAQEREEHVVGPLYAVLLGREANRYRVLFVTPDEGGSGEALPALEKVVLSIRCFPEQL